MPGDPMSLGPWLVDRIRSSGEPKPPHLPVPTVAKNLIFARKKAELTPNLLEKTPKSPFRGSSIQPVPALRHLSDNLHRVFRYRAQ
jgi:hypothetical protein